MNLQCFAFKIVILYDQVSKYCVLFCPDSSHVAVLLSLAGHLILLPHFCVSPKSLTYLMFICPRFINSRMTWQELYISLYLANILL